MSRRVHDEVIPGKENTTTARLLRVTNEAIECPSAVTTCYNHQ